MANEKKGLSNTVKVGIGAASMAALAAAAAGAYYFYGADEANKNRKMMKSWMVKAKGEMMERLENLKDLTEENYEDAVDQILQHYKKIKSIDPVELTMLARELKGSWDRISKLTSKTSARKPARAKVKKVTTVKHKAAK